jgi:hypothetical protein
MSDAERPLATFSTLLEQTDSQNTREQGCR